jgi:hypothetical protein
MSGIARMDSVSCSERLLMLYTLSLAGSAGAVPGDFGVNIWELFPADSVFPFLFKGMDDSPTS